MFCLIPNILILLILIKTINTASIDSVSISFNVLESYQGGSNVQIVIKNNGNSPICSVKFFMSLPSGSVTQSNRNVRLRGNNKYRTPDNVKIDPGSSYNEAGVVIKGNGKPTLYVLDVDECGNNNNGDQNTATTKASGNNNPPSSDNLVVGHNQDNVKGMCISNNNPANLIEQQLNKQINGGKFTFYGAGGRGACGYNSDDPPMSAAASGSLFTSGTKWVPSCFSDNRYVLNDNICVNKCVKIEYKGKTLTVPITNQCPECELNHVDLSIPAFNWLEPLGGVVGIATNAVITYINCGN